MNVRRGFPLSKRLAAAAELIRGGEGVTDVGTDHAYLPAYLVISGKCPRMLACDVGEEPLKNAEKTLAEYGLRDKIELRLSDGLQNVSPEEAREIVICGMGGTLIARILTAAPWVRRPGTHLVLQPMTHLEDVRQYLCENGFSSMEERCVQDGGRTYCFISAVWTGEHRKNDLGYYYFGELLGKTGPAEKITEKQLRRLQTRVACLDAAGIRREEADRLRDALAYYERKRHEDSGDL